MKANYSMIGGDYLSRILIHRERFLEAIEKVLMELDSPRNKESDEFNRGAIIGFEMLKHELGYDKMIPRNANRRNRREDR